MKSPDCFAVEVGLLSLLLHAGQSVRAVPALLAVVVQDISEPNPAMTPTYHDGQVSPVQQLDHGGAGDLQQVRGLLRGQQRVVRCDLHPVPLGERGRDVVQFCSSLGKE